MLNLDPAKLLVIAVVAVILLGPDRLPQVARQIGGAWRTLNEFRHRMESEVRSSIPDLPSSGEIARLARSPSALLNHLSNMSSDADGTTVSQTTTAADPLGNATLANAAATAPLISDSVSHPSVAPPLAMQAHTAQPEAIGSGDPGMN
jgi:Sec-independent protein translocase protein TatA